VLTAVNPNTLKPDFNQRSLVLESLVECLKAILSSPKGEPKPRLVLAGDVLELALATTNEAATVFARFIELLFDNGEPVVDGTIIYVPGNHDHHLWETARERQYASYVSEPDTEMPLKNPPWHTTHLFPWRKELDVENRDVESFLLTTLAKKVASSMNIRVQTMYPNFAVLSADGKSRCTVVHHGHFTESIYYLMTELRKIVFPDRQDPDEIWDVEAENYAWIDFLWGTLGRSGEVGEDLEIVYNMLRSKKATGRLIRKLARSVPARFKHPWWARWLESLLIWLVLTLLVNRFRKLERGAPDWPLSEKSNKLLKRYIGQYVRGQLQREYQGGLLDQLTFVFGHTHKPYETVLEDVSGVEAAVHIYNMGGWVIDTIHTAPRQGGAIVVIDEDGYAASIRMYNQSDDPASYQVRVARADSEAGEYNPLYEDLKENLIKPEKPPWSDFSSEVEKAVKVRRQYLKELIRRVE
jgi:UDP-2,3-diacylglucosamine pyrophosphatase LpxH